MTRPKLYALGFSPSCQRVFATLGHKGVDYDLVEIDITKKERPAAFNALSPFGKVPVMVHDGHTLLESAVINEYIDEVWPNPPMLPADPAGRARARQWIAFANRVVVDADGEMVHVEREQERKAAIAHRICAGLAPLDRELAGNKAYFCGPELSLVDTALAPYLQLIPIWADLVGDRKYAGYANIRAYFDRLKRNPVLQKQVFGVPAEALRGFFKMILVDGATVP